MRKTVLAIVVLFTFLTFGLILSKGAHAAWVDGYYRSNGTYVSGYYRSRANAYTYDNYSYTGPSNSNGYGYNDSYYSSDRSSSWYTPSYNDNSWSYEDSWSDSNSGRSSYYYW